PTEGELPIVAELELLLELGDALGGDVVGQRVADRLRQLSITEDQPQLDAVLRQTEELRDVQSDGLAVLRDTAQLKGSGESREEVLAGSGACRAREVDPGVA